MPQTPVEYPIDDSVPIPTDGLNIPFRDLEVGQSVMFPSERRASVQTIASRLKKEEGKVFTIRKVDDQNCRIWRKS